ncbi:hypothetical protein Nepgr_015580 [Nepenthes gracilis]|uniref:AAA ATPase AAA+ lid domain-containing protein n=1 Tax=Nepenthes gracilis TaxID=150966 RepID=A0AAD3XR85_NEPGR|nr:hypothetical protein Nepgr_015580 [Nepenthes gracilis]
MQGLRYSVLTRNLRLEGEFDLVKIARVTPGFVGADLSALCNKACNLAMRRVTELRRSRLSKESADGEDTEEWWRKPWLPEEVEKLSITMADFEEFGVDLETGFWLYGPLVVVKHLLPKLLLMRQEPISYISRKRRANGAVPSFTAAGLKATAQLLAAQADERHLEEIGHALTTKQGKERGWVVERLLNQLLIELDGADMSSVQQIEVMHRAVLRPGRFGKLLYVPLPTPDERSLILKALGRRKPIDPGVDLLAIGKSTACKNISGADLAALMNEAAMAALKRNYLRDQQLGCFSLHH